MPMRVVLVEPMRLLKVVLLQCKRCGREWVPRKQEWPKRCPNHACRSVYWDTERKAAG